MQNESDNGKPRVLVIDDDQALLRMIRLSMTFDGFDVATAQDGIAALEQMDTSEFDVVVLDLQMPRMDGRTFFHEMVSRGHRPKVVVLSAYGAEEAQRELKIAAAVPKPFDPDDLIETVRRVAAHSSTRSA
jgi:two-component system chemotaxis response regulator CheY